MMKKISGNFSLLAFLLLMVGVLFPIRYIENKTSEESVQVVESNIRKAAISCYAIEGAYPQTMDYLEDHYGLQFDHDKYVVEYDIIGSNVMPWIAVAEKGSYYFDNSWS